MTADEPARVADLPPNVRLVGGEMLLWSDDPAPPESDHPAAQATAPCRAAGPPRCGQAVRELLRRIMPDGAAVLLVGPHPEDFVSWVAERAASVAVVLRSHPDACRLGRGHLGVPAFTVYCGRLDKLPDLPPFDVVCALDGFDRVHSAESPGHTWRDTLAQVTGLVSEGGTLVLATRNDLGMDAFVEAKPYERTDGDWFPAGLDPTYPARHEAVTRELHSHGLAERVCYAGFPSAHAPRALFSVETLNGAPPLPDAVTVAACAQRHHGRQVIADPVRLAAKAFKYGLADRLAPLWLTVAHRPEPYASDTFPTPAALVEDNICEHPWTRVCELVHDEIYGTWTRRPLPVAATLRMDRVLREPDALSGPLPQGRLLDEVLLTACAFDDLPRVRETLRSLCGWLSRQAVDGLLPGHLAFATTDNLAWDDDRPWPIDPGWSLLAPVPLPVALSRVLWRFADGLLAGGHHHPWPWDLDADRLTGTLLALCGLPFDAGALAEAKALDADLAATLGTAAPQASPPETYRVVLAARDRMRESLTSAQARIDRLEIKLTGRERELRRTRRKLRRARRKVVAMRHSFANRAVRGMTWPLRTGARLVRRG
ncbi:hypothetical protein [Spongiactinospora sp. TRM90649]|uniref:hypothetical protein n=1 Tax=Spongiactinospora sp. TRM90649 TaxID=3031114 RepID=UPI0023F702EB|nr:hypothetical protein [Spongiactinospora sp. TRM90649]MDF5751404.1 hypothetical protein [Spongiactinospora sp. TRM90649]